MNPTKRIAIEIAGQSAGVAAKALECQCFTQAEISEIIAGLRRCYSGVLSPQAALHCPLTDDVETVEAQIRSTIECSVRIGDRLPDEVNW